MWWSDTRTHGQMINPNNTSNHHIVPICVFLPNSGISGNTILLITFLKKKAPCPNLEFIMALHLLHCLWSLTSDNGTTSHVSLFQTLFTSNLLLDFLKKFIYVFGSCSLVILGHVYSMFILPYKYVLHYTFLLYISTNKTIDLMDC